MIISLISITNGFSLEMNFNDSNVKQFINKKMQPKFKLFSFFSTKSDNKIIYDKKNHLKQSKESCVFMYQEELMHNNTLALKSQYNSSSLDNCPGFMISETIATIAMRDMNLKGKLMYSTLYIFNGTGLLIMFDGCYYLDTNGSKIEIYWFLADEPNKFQTTELNENFYDKFTTKKLKFNGVEDNVGCVYLNLNHYNLFVLQKVLENSPAFTVAPQKSKEENNFGISISFFICFSSILFSIILFSLILFSFKNKFSKEIHSVRIVHPIKEDHRESIRREIVI